MTWAKYHIEKLLAGETVRFRPTGNSMTPKIQSKQLCTVEPIKDHTALQKGDVVLCRVSGNDYLHLISAIGQDGQFQISNNHGFINGWINPAKIYGNLIKVES